MEKIVETDNYEKMTNDEKRWRVDALFAAIELLRVYGTMAYYVLDYELENYKIKNVSAMNEPGYSFRGPGGRCSLLCEYDICAGFPPAPFMAGRKALRKKALGFWLI